MIARPRGTDGSLLDSLPWTLAALAVSLAPHVPFLPIWITAAFFACATWRYIIERQRRMLPSAWHPEQGGQRAGNGGALHVGETKRIDRAVHIFSSERNQCCH